jgi:F-box protein 9
VPNTAHHSLEGPSKPINELIASFADLKIAAAPPAIEGTEPPPCPLADLPEEILIHIMTDLALLDVGSFTKTAQVCKKLAYVVMHEEQIWKKVCHSTTSGFPAMHYKWQREVMGGPLIEDVEEELDDNDPNSSTSITVPPTKEEVTESLYNEGYSSSWQRMFRHRPRIRFNGCYISTVNYMRAGQATQSSTTWGSPVHIVTYFRYLRFFRDGTVISLLTTVEPAEVVHNLTKELQKLHHKGSAAYLPTIFMQHVLKGRWRLSSIADDPEASLKDAEGDVYVETEGANEKYLYRMKFSLANAGKTVRNNKLNWQGFWCYNMLTDDTGEFPGKNDKAYHFSRVKSYGLGE